MRSLKLKARLRLSIIIGMIRRRIVGLMSLKLLNIKLIMRCRAWVMSILKLNHRIFKTKLLFKVSIQTNRKKFLPATWRIKDKFSAKRVTKFNFRNCLRRLITMEFQKWTKTLLKLRSTPTPSTLSKWKRLSITRIIQLIWAFQATRLMLRHNKKSSICKRLFLKPNRTTLMKFKNSILILYLTKMSWSELP